jgi:CheY-like chemotaxis protein
MRRILVVDDNEDVREAMTDLLEMVGCTIQTAHDGPSAVAAVTENKPDVVLLDLGMPGMSGYEVAPRLRELPGGNDLLIVALSGWGTPEVLSRTRDAGFDRHMLKPVGLAELRALL